MTHGTLLTFMLICGLCIVAGQNPQYVLKGEEIQIIPNIPAGQRLDEILWKHDGNKVVEFDGSEEHVYGRYQNRITLFWETADLRISKVQLEDSGTYELEVFTNNQLRRVEYSWQVLAKVAKPTITCLMKDASGTNTSVSQATLVCSLGPENPPMTKFAWSLPGQVQVHYDASLTISLKDRHQDHLYTCYVSNPKSQNSTQFNAKDCYPDDSSSLSLVWIVVPVVAVIILIALLVFFRRRLTARCGKEEDKEAQLQEQSPQKEALLPSQDETPSNTLRFKGAKKGNTVKASDETESLLSSSDKTPSKTQGDSVAKEGDRAEDKSKELQDLLNRGSVSKGKGILTGKNFSPLPRPNAADVFLPPGEPSSTPATPTEAQSPPKSKQEINMEQAEEAGPSCEENAESDVQSLEATESKILPGDPAKEGEKTKVLGAESNGGNNPPPVPQKPRRLAETELEEAKKAPPSYEENAESDVQSPLAVQPTVSDNSANEKFVPPSSSQSNNQHEEVAEEGNSREAQLPPKPERLADTEQAKEAGPSCEENAESDVQWLEATEKSILPDDPAKEAKRTESVGAESNNGDDPPPGEPSTTADKPPAQLPPKPKRLADTEQAKEAGPSCEENVESDVQSPEATVPQKPKHLTERELEEAEKAPPSCEENAESDVQSPPAAQPTASDETESLSSSDEIPSDPQGDTVAKEGNPKEERAKEKLTLRNQGIVRGGRKTWSGPPRPNAAANQNLPEEAGKTDTARAENSNEEDRESDDPSPTDNQTEGAEDKGTNPAPATAATPSTPVASSTLSQNTPDQVSEKTTMGKAEGC